VIEAAAAMLLCEAATITRLKNKAR